MTVTNPTIENKGSGTPKVFQSSGTTTLTLWGLQSEDIRKSAGTIDLPMPTLDSNGKIIMDLMGTSREITVEGEVGIGDSGIGAGNLYKFAADIAGLGNTSLVYGTQGDNYGQYQYKPESLNRGKSDPQITINVVVTEVSIKSESGNPNSLKYSITMMEFGTLV